MANSQTEYDLRNQSFASALLDPDMPIPDGVGKNNHPAPKRFSVYRNNVVVSLMEAMKKTFPSLLAMMGDENFSKVARNYIAVSPPQSPMMQQFGRTFPKFITDFKPLAKSPFLADVAMAEVCAIRSFHAPDGPVLSPEELGSVAPDDTLNLVFTKHPACYLITSQFPVYDLFEARNTWPCEGINLETAQSVLITRPQHTCLFFNLDIAQTKFFNSLISGATLGEAIATGMAADEAFDPSNAITLTLQSGAFLSLNTFSKPGE